MIVPVSMEGKYASCPAFHVCLSLLHFNPFIAGIGAEIHGEFNSLKHLVLSQNQNNACHYFCI
jgi:hypothetical protein